MHYLMKMVFNKDWAKNSLEARKLVFRLMSCHPLIYEKAGFACYHEYTLGGQWTGWLAIALLDPVKLKDFYKEITKRYGWHIVCSIFSGNAEYDQRRIQARELFLQHFPDFQGEPLFFRSEYTLLGYEDDAALVENKHMYDRCLSHSEGKVCDTNGWYAYTLDLNGDVINPENVIGKKWVVLIDCHT